MEAGGQILPVLSPFWYVDGGAIDPLCFDILSLLSSYPPFLSFLRGPA